MSGIAEERYRALEHLRQPYLDRARDCSELTIPSLIPPDAHNETSDIYTPFQGIGAYRKRFGTGAEPS